MEIKSCLSNSLSICTDKITVAENRVVANNNPFMDCGHWDANSDRAEITYVHCGERSARDALDEVDPYS